MLNEEIYYKSVIGTDEVGTGEALRPQVFVACYVPSYQIMMLEEMGVKDSKKLKREKAVALGKELSEKLIFAKYEMTNGYLNQVYTKIPNLNQIKAIAHNFVIGKILKNENTEDGINVEKIIIDQFCPLDKFHEYTNNSLKDDERLLLIEKGESAHLAVAAASLIATYFEEEMIKQIEDEIGEELPGGNTSKVSEFIKEHASDDNAFLEKYAKTSFKSVDKYLTK